MVKTKIFYISILVAFLLGIICSGLGVYLYTRDAMAEITELNKQSEIDLRQANEIITGLKNTNIELTKNNIELRKSSDNISKSNNRAIELNQELNNGYNEIQKLIGEVNNTK
jgi:hypothetical protein